jgi:hypothetical protein
MSGTEAYQTAEQTCVGRVCRFGLMTALALTLYSPCRADPPQRAFPASSVASQQPSNQAAEQSKGQLGEHELPVWVRGLLELLKVFVSWPALAALVLIYFATSVFAPYKLAKVLRPFRSLKIFGAEFVLSHEAIVDAEQGIVIYRKQVKRHFDMLVDNDDVRGKLACVIKRVQTEIAPLKQLPGDVRWTIHVADVLFADTLYQLVDYYPRGGGRARVFSFRFGVIGLCWRKKERVVRAKVPKGNDPNGREQLLETWGMSEEQASASGSGRQSFFAVPLRDKSNTPVGIFYMDSKEEDAFGADEDGHTAEAVKAAKIVQALESATIKACREEGLTTSLSKINDDFKDKRPAIRIHEQ